ADRVLKLENGSIVSETYGVAQAVQNGAVGNGTAG
ncbi:MAG: hypothetical protein QOC89_733, partial [Paraburkholderia sp.]|nr:hypothetical protein [Paraburkholderia sp.]